ncbi:MAG: hypothetical protein ABJN39_09460 [Sulfitobacter sp.]|uniref:hypothetical protein n=1 Tax=Alphaproteobacteria TaxID=28211 RepID=UPI00294249C9|nr:hypothetical protein [Sulfitobacter sp. LC.270.F.C4]WOI13531.1 hypothetical protein R1T45_01860 [Sulfitobacter sp. LC.270.F.C4]
MSQRENELREIISDLIQGARRDRSILSSKAGPLHIIETRVTKGQVLRAIHATSQEAMQWQPIETAPKDQLIDIWLADGLRWCDCYYDRICDEWRTSRPSCKLVTIKARFVTHWMFPPAAPVDDDTPQCGAQEAAR